MILVADLWAANNSLAGHVAQFWNTIEPSLLLMYQKLEELGFTYDNNKVTYIEVLPEVRDVRPL